MNDLSQSVKGYKLSCKEKVTGNEDGQPIEQVIEGSWASLKGILLYFITRKVQSLLNLEVYSRSLGYNTIHFKIHIQKFWTKFCS